MNVNLLGKGFVDSNCVADWIVISNSSNWFIEVEKQEDWYIWQPSFTATHESLGTIAGDDKGNIKINATESEEDLIACFNSEVECYLGDFDPGDI